MNDPTNTCTDNLTNYNANKESTNSLNNKSSKDLSNIVNNKSITNLTNNLIIKPPNNTNNKLFSSPTNLSNNTTSTNINNNFKINSFINSINNSKKKLSTNSNNNLDNNSSIIQKNTLDNKSVSTSSNKLNIKSTDSLNNKPFSNLAKNVDMKTSSNSNNKLNNKSSINLNTFSNEVMDNNSTINSNFKSLRIINSNLNKIASNIPVNNLLNNSSNNSTIIADINALNSTKSFATTIYRKPTYTGLITKWNSFVPYSYKVSTISKFIGILNGYPEGFIKSQIRKTLEQNKNNKDNSLKKEQVFIDIPFFGRSTEIFGKRIINLAKSINPQIRIQPIQRPPSSLSKYFPIKDPIPKSLKSNAVYKLDCSNCEATYIGKIIRQICRRLQEHGADLIKEKETKSYYKDVTDNSSNLQRSERNKGKVIRYFPKTHNELTLFEQNNVTHSAVKQHENNNNHTEQDNVII
ncbi:unnamed protein product [Rotaria sp. Silwood2]|nr:unnamed protein product [Rotaria sp. Silwood2]